MYNPIQAASKGNRKARRWAASAMGIPLDAYPPTMMPINLGIQEYKRKHVDDNKRIAYYKEEMWKAFRELHSVKEANASK